MELGGEWLIWKHNHPMARNKGGGGVGGGECGNDRLDLQEASLLLY